MPSGRTKSKDDTWNPDELSKSMKEIRDEKKKSRDSNKTDSKRKEGDNKERRKRDEGRSEKSDERRVRRERERSSEDQRRSHHGEKENRERRHKDRKDEDDRERRHRRKEEEKKDDDREKRRERRKHERDEDEDREKRRDRRHKDEDEERKRDRRKHGEREEDDDRERRRDRRRHEDKNEDEDREKRRERRHHDRDEDDRERRRERSKRKEQEDESDKRRRDKDDDNRRRHRDEDRQRSKGHDEDDKERRHHRSSRQRQDDDDSDRKAKSNDRIEKIEEEMAENGKEEEAKAEDDYNYDDEDFEDYDDDFENDDDDEDENDDRISASKKPSGMEDMDELLQAMDEENRRLLQSRSSSDLTDKSDERDRAKSNRDSRVSGRTFINFVSAKQHVLSDKAASKTRQRSKELAKMIDLEVSSYDMFDLPPLNEYELYMMSFGRSNTKQAYIQSNEDNVDRDIQTDEIEDLEKWCQHPPLNFGACGGGNLSVEEEEEYEDQSKPNPLRLGHFMQSAGHVITSLLEEENSHNSQSDLSRRSDICVSDSFIQLSTPEFLTDRHVTYSHFSTVQTQSLLTIHSLNQQGDEGNLKNNGVICMWNVNEPSKPDKILTCEAVPTCCCFSPVTANLVFAGMSDGSVVVWDLREPSSMHSVHSLGDQVCQIRRPTFHTAGVYSDDNHHSAVTTVLPVISPSERVSTHSSSASRTDTDSGSGLSFQLATLEENGILNLWVVAEIANPDPAGSDSDLSLSPGGKVKLLKSSTLTLENPLRNSAVKSSQRAYEMQLLPSNPNHFYVGTDSGYVIHGVRYGGKAPPRAYKSEFDNPVHVISIDFSPFSESCFLAGCEDGSLRLHRIHLEKPVLSWPDVTSGAGLQCVRWSRSRPGVFYVLDNDSNLHIWHLLMNDAVPIKTDRLKSRVSSMSLSNDHSATGIGTLGRQAQMVLAYEDGNVEVHQIQAEFAAAAPDELDQFESLMEKLD